MERAKAFGWHLILHLDAQDLVEFREMFLKIPVPMVIDHMGRVVAKDGQVGGYRWGAERKARLLQGEARRRRS